MSAPSPTSTPRLVLRGREIDLSRPLVMGIVNATPDSFSDAGELPDADARVRRAVELAGQGAHFIDVGGQSGITGVPEIDAAEEIDRVLPVVRGIRAALPDVPVSVDTYKPAVAQAVLEEGTALINDVSGLLHPEIADLCAEAGAGLVVMHNRSRPKERLTSPTLYEENGVAHDVVTRLGQLLADATDRGLPADATLVDPGPDFSKTPHQTITVLGALDRVRALGRPLLLPLSRKDFVGALTDRPPRERLAGTLAAIGHALAGTGGTGTVFRVHDVAEVSDFLRVAGVLAGREPVPIDLTLAPHLRRQPAPGPDGPATTV